MTGSKRNLHTVSCALGLVFVSMTAAVGCDAMGDADARKYDGANVASTGEDGDTAGDTEGDGEDGCTLTQGFWKNHSSHAKNKSQQQAWPISEETVLCGQSWYDILKIAPKGDAWYVVAHQWIAASLNVASGAVPSPEVVAVLTDLEASLADCQISKAEKAAALAGSELLDAFNNGDIGPGHCGDGDVPGVDPAPETGTDTGDDPGTTGDTGDTGTTGDTGDCIVDCDSGTTGEPWPIPG